MFIVGLILLFLAKLRFGGRPITATLTNRYGHATLQLYRRIEKLEFRVKKIEEDLKFLDLCQSYRLIPNFLKFKTYCKKFQFTKTYFNWQFKLLEYEIRKQKTKHSKLLKELEAYQ